MIEPDWIAEADALFKLGRWIYAVFVLVICCFNDMEHRYAYIVGLTVTITYASDCCITWLHVRQENKRLCRKEVI